MEALRSVTVVSLTELLLVGTFTPGLEVNEEAEHHSRRHHCRAAVHHVTADRGNCPVIFNWLSTPETSSSPAGE